MNPTDNARPSPPPSRLGRAATSLAGASVVVTAVYLILIGAQAPQAATEPAAGPPETFIAEAFTPASSSSPLTGSLPLSPSATPIGSASATPVGTPPPVVAGDHVATRVRVPELHIDLAVVAPPRDRSSYPKCGVAMYLGGLHQPGQGGATYLYAHARTGMFLPIYERAIRRLYGGPRSLLGLSVEVFTSDDLRYLYTVKEVRVHQTSLADAAHARSDELWLQTSEGPKGTRGKTQVLAVPVGVQAATHRQAHPVAKPVTCG